MARILFAWELGGGLGHLTRAHPIIQELQLRGHVVSAALRDRRQLPTAWPNLKIELYDAPHKAFPTADEIHPVKYYSQLLYNIGWSNPHELLPLLKGWQDIYHSAKPDFVFTRSLPDRHVSFAAVSNPTRFDRHGILHTSCGIIFVAPAHLERQFA